MSLDGIHFFYPHSCHPEHRKGSEYNNLMFSVISDKALNNSSSLRLLASLIETIFSTLH